MMGKRKRPKRKLPGQRTMELFRSLPGMHAIQTVERWQATTRRNTDGEAKGGGGIRVDLFGFIDHVALTDRGIIGVQSCAYSSIAARAAKIMEIPEARIWNEHAGILIVGWQSKPFVRKDGTVSEHRKDHVATVHEMWHDGDEWQRHKIDLRGFA